MRTISWGRYWVQYGTDEGMKIVLKTDSLEQAQLKVKRSKYPTFAWDCWSRHVVCSNYQVKIV